MTTCITAHVAKRGPNPRRGLRNYNLLLGVKPGPHLLRTESAGRNARRSGRGARADCPPGPDKPRQRGARGTAREPGVSARGDPATLPRGPQPADVPLDPHHTSPAQIKWTKPISFFFFFFCFSGALPSDPPAVAPPQAVAAPYQWEETGPGWVAIAFWTRRTTDVGRPVLAPLVDPGTGVVNTLTTISYPSPASPPSNNCPPSYPPADWV